MKWMLSLLLLAALCAGIGLAVGPQAISPDAAGDIILWQVRLPRVLLGILVGMALSASGSTFQAILRNPLADPYILGVSGGAALGSVMGVLLHLPFAMMVALAFATSILTMVFLVWAVGRQGSSQTLLLAGVIFNAFTFAVIMLVHTLVRMEDAHAILFLLIGSLETVSLKTVAVVAMAVLPAIAWLTWHGAALNALCLGSDTAQSVGIDPVRFSRRAFIAASVMIGAVVAVAGLIGFVGLFIPHMVRILLGSDHRLVVPASALVGGGFLVLADSLARSLSGLSLIQTELPVGVITALIGGPVFVWLLRRDM
jgi:iron complex transport system permease protein